MTAGASLHEPRPELFAPLLAPFRLSWQERLLGGLLVRLLRVPGTTRLLALWHARRSRE